MKRILVINPGGGSTKLAVYEDDKCVMSETVTHPRDETGPPGDMVTELEVRKRAIGKFLKSRKVDLAALDAVVGRGGCLKPVESGTYRVTRPMVDDILAGRVQAEHASNFGPLLAYEIAESIGRPAFIVDPVSVDEFIPEARLSGDPRLPRKSLDHPLNAKMVARRAAREMGRSYSDINVIVAHLGTGISVSPHRKGRMIDVNNAHDGGPFSTQRTGSLPVTQLIDLCYSGTVTREEMLAAVTRHGGLAAYLGTDDLKKVEEMVRDGDEKAQLVLRAMAYQIAKEIGGAAAALRGRVDAVIYTGGMAHSTYLVGLIREWVDFLSDKVFVYPGEHERESLAIGALRVLEGEEEPRQYK
jgi:butyrate kinase